MKETLIINLFGAPGSGKSTTMAGVFAKLKARGYDCEMVTEFAKDLVWEKREETFKDELYIFAKQAHRIFRVNGKVDIIITDRPLLATVLFNNLYGKKSKNLDNLVIEEFNSYNNMNFLIERVGDYQSNGRNENEDASNRMQIMTEGILQDLGLLYHKVKADEKAVDIISDAIEIIWLVKYKNK